MGDASLEGGFPPPLAPPLLLQGCSLSVPSQDAPQQQEPNAEPARCPLHRSRLCHTMTGMLGWATQWQRPQR